MIKRLKLARVLGFVTLVYTLLGGTFVLGLVIFVGFTQPGLRVDWSRMPAQAVIPYWMTVSLTAPTGFVLASGVGSLGFFRRSSGIDARALLFSYSTATFLVSFLAVGSPLYLMMKGPLRLAPNTAALFGPSDVVSAAIIAMIFLIPAIGALFLLGHPGSTAQLGFEIGEMNIPSDRGNGVTDA